METTNNFDKEIRKNFDNLPELIFREKGENIVFDVYNEELDFKSFYELFEEIIEEGIFYVQDTLDEKTFREIFLSHNCFVFRLAGSHKTIAGFYIKPVFPGRASHTANTGIAIKKEYRSQGLGQIMSDRIEKYTKILGYEASYAQLAFVTNTASIELAKKNGAVIVGRIPRAANLKGFGYTDAVQLYFDYRSKL